MRPDALEVYMDAAAALMDVEISPEGRAETLRNLRLLFDHAERMSPVAELPIDHAEILER